LLDYVHPIAPHHIKHLGAPDEITLAAGIGFAPMSVGQLQAVEELRAFGNYDPG
jgi:hypothetical protein